MAKVAGANQHVFEDAANWPMIGTFSLSGYERPSVLVHAGQRGWVNVADRVGARDEYDGRAVAIADLSNRGALDVIVANQNQPVVIYRSTPDAGNHWIGLKLVGTRSNRSAIGAEVTLEAGGIRQRQVVDGGSGFASQNDRRLHFGLGRYTEVTRLTVHWPSGAVQYVNNLAIDRIHTLTEPDR
jgi:hypothetical protein